MKEEKDIIEGNKLIAKLCGWKIEYSDKRNNSVNAAMKVDSNNWDSIITVGKGFTRETIEEAEEYLWNNLCNSKYGRQNYYSDYIRIMPILQKIEKLGCIIEINYALVVTCRICYLGKNKNDKAINFYGDNNGGREPIEAIWDCVVEFLKFYNENIKE